MAESIASDLAVKLLESLGKFAAQKLAPYFGGQGKLNELQLAMELIQARLLDAERRREGEDSFLIKQWLKRLKGMLYKFDDLFEDVSLAYKEREHIVHAGRLSNPVRYGKNKSDHLKLNKKVSQEFEAIMSEMEAIKYVMGGLNLREYSIEEQRALNFVIKRETHSIIMEEEVIGRKNDKDVMSLLKHSYDHLPSQLKQCFAYCSLFPKDHEFDKESLIWLWMAQGFIRPPRNESLEAEGDKYFMELLRRGFFQHVIRNESDRIVGCKMHDLMNDLACEVGDECLLVLADGSLEKINEDTRHVSLSIENLRVSSLLLLSVKHRRSLFCRDFHYADTCYMKTFLSRWEYLRALELRGPLISVICNSIGELKHLRYLKLVGSDICLPDGITRLHNLQTLDLCEMSFLEKLPTGLSEMMSLRHLRIGSDFRLKDMPPSFGELTSLRALDCFVVGENNGLDALASLDLSGELSIYVRKYREEAKPEAKKANLKGKKLTSLKLNWMVDEVTNDEEEVLEWLEPPPSLEELRICDWKGVKLPVWRRMHESAFPKLVSIEIEWCRRCVYLPPLSRLPRLRHLCLRGLDALEYIEHGDEGGDMSEASSSTNYFPSLEHLELDSLRELKGWSRVGNGGGGCWKLPRLLKLEIKDCPYIMYMPLVPRVRELNVNDIPDKLSEQLLVNRE